jgi:hypothetical protein
VVQPSVNGVEVGEPVNLYSPQLGVLAVVHDEITLLEGTNDVSFTVVGTDPASTEHHFAIDTIVLEPATTSRIGQLDRALAWLAAHPADLFDGGRQAIGAEIATLYSLWAHPLMAARRPALRVEIELRLRKLASMRGDWILPGETGALLVAAHVARQLDLLPGGSPWLASAVRRATALSNAEGSALRPLVFCESLRRLAPAGESSCQHDQSVLFQESVKGSLLSSLNGPVDRATAPAISAALHSIVEDVKALTDQGREPLPSTALVGGTGFLGPLCEQGLRWGRETGDVLLVARLVLLAKLAGVETSVPSLRAALDDLLRWQEPDGSFGVTSPYSANPRRDGVLAAMMALAFCAE